MVRTRSPAKALSLIVLTALLLSSLPYGSAEPSPLGDDDAGSGTDAGDHEDEALPIGPGTYTGRLTPVIDHADWYAFNVTAGQGITARADEALYPPYLYLVGPDRSYSVRSSRDTNVLAAEDGTWYLAVFSSFFTSLATDYGFSVGLVDLPFQDDAGSGRDATRDDPVVLPDGVSNGTLNKFDTQDTFVFDVTGTQHIQVAITTNITDHKSASLSSSECCDGSYDGGRGTLFLEHTFTDTTVRLNLRIYSFFDQITGGDYQIDLVRTPVEEVALPDLVVTSIVEHRRNIQTDFGEAPNPVNERRVYEVEITNQGAGDANAFEVSFRDRRGHDHDPYDYPFGEYAFVRELAAGESTTLFFQWDTTTRIGDYTIVVTVDGFREVMETDDDNNVGFLHTYVRVGGVI